MSNPKKSKKYEIYDEESESESDTSTVAPAKKITIEKKPNRPKSEAQIKAFEKARMKRAENILLRQEEKQKELDEFRKLKEMKQQLK
jgi:hypothetical protein